MRNYIGLIHKDAESGYGVSFPDFPGVVTAGTDLDDAPAVAEEALALHVEGLPEPSNLETVMSDLGSRWRLRVRRSPPSSSAISRARSTNSYRGIIRPYIAITTHDRSRRWVQLIAGSKCRSYVS